MTVVTHDCGCEQRGERFFECRYHEGFRDAMEQATGLLLEVEEALVSFEFDKRKKTIERIYRFLQEGVHDQS